MASASAADPRLGAAAEDRSPLTAAAPRRGWAVLILMAASGFAGLGYQIVWTQQAALWLGHEAPAVLAVTAAFFAGLACGAGWLGARIARTAAPARWYAACEATIALWAAALLALVPAASGLLLDLAGPEPSPGRQWTVAFAGTFFLLLPATAAMGATLPALERVVAGIGRGGRGRAIAACYASNTLGAMAGVAAAAFWLVPELGLQRTTIVCAGLNLICGAAAWRLLPRAVGTLPPPATSAPADGADTPAPPGARRGACARLALTGLLGIGYEVVVVRVLSQVSEDTVYTFAALLVVYLGASAAGAAAEARRLRRGGADRPGFDRLLCALAAACAAGTLLLYAAEFLRGAWLSAFGSGLATAIAGEAALAAVAFALPAYFMGALFSRLAARAQALGVGFGRALAVNTASAALAPLAFGVLLAPALGAAATLALIGAGYVALVDSGRRWRAAFAALPIAGAALALAAPPLVFVDLPDGGRVVSYREGVAAAVSVVEDGDGIARLRINNRQQEGSSATGLVDGRQALLPLLLHPAPGRALFLGLGTGTTAATAAMDADLQVDAVELLPEVVAASALFTDAMAHGTPNPRLHVVAADARRYVRTTPRRWDVIVADNFHPARSGSGALYTVEHFEAVRARLADGGLFCQWLPLHQLDLATLRSVVRSYLAAFPEGGAILASNSLETPVLGLVGGRDALRIDPATVAERLRRAKLPIAPASYGLDDRYAVLGSFVADAAALRRFAAIAPLNTDDRPVVAYRAPRITYAADSLPRDRLLVLLHQLSVDAGGVLAAVSSADDRRRLTAYWAARDRYVEVGRDVRPTRAADAMLAQVRAPLLDVLRISADFRPARVPLRRLAAALAETDADAARRLRAEIDATELGPPQRDPARRDEKPADAPPHGPGGSRTTRSPTY